VRRRQLLRLQRRHVQGAAARRQRLRVRRVLPERLVLVRQLHRRHRHLLGAGDVPVRRAVALLFACSGAPAVAPDASPDAAAPDAHVAPDPNSAPCAAPAPLGTLAPLTSGDAEIDEGADATHYEIDYQGRIADTQLLTLVFKEGSGAFAGGFAPGTYPITGDD